MKLQSRSVRNPRSPYAKENGLGSARDSRGLPGRPQRWVHPLVAIRRRAKHPNAGRTIRRRSTFARNPDIESVAQAPSAHRSPSIAGLHWSSFCLKQFGSPKSWHSGADPPRHHGAFRSATTATRWRERVPLRAAGLGANTIACRASGARQRLYSGMHRNCDFVASRCARREFSDSSGEAARLGRPELQSFGELRRELGADGDGRATMVGTSGTRRCLWLSFATAVPSAAMRVRKAGSVPGARDYAGSIVRYPFVVSVAP